MFPLSLDMSILARVQFAFTISFHIIFPSFTIGLASYLAMLEGLWLKTGKDKYLTLYRFWVKIFAISFGMGVVSGVVMSYQFGTNWSRFSEITGNVLGPLLGYEVLTAFFLEASFLAIMLFGWNRVGRRLHFLSTCIVATGTLISAFWILAANSWMHTPAGYEIRDGIFYAVNWLDVIFNPSFPYRFVHMIFASYLTTAFVVIAVAAYLNLSGKNNTSVTTMLKMGLVFIGIFVPLQMLAGHEHGINVFEHQPVKLAAMEGHWETHTGAPLVLFALPDQQEEKNKYELAIPKLGSVIVAHDINAKIRGLKEWPREERPPVAVVFWSFRLMVGIGMLMLFTAITGLWFLKSGNLKNKYFLKLCLCMGPSGFFAVLAGWFTAETGRQPYTVYGLVKTIESTSPVTTNSVGMSLIVFVFTYIVVFSAGLYYILKLMKKGPDDSLKPHDDLESEPVLGTRLDIGEFEHQFKLSTQPVVKEKPG